MNLRVSPLSLNNLSMFLLFLRTWVGVISPGACVFSMPFLHFLSRCASFCAARRTLMGLPLAQLLFSPGYRLEAISVQYLEPLSFHRFHRCCLEHSFLSREQPAATLSYAAARKILRLLDKFMCLPPNLVRRAGTGEQAQVGLARAYKRRWAFSLRTEYLVLERNSADSEHAAGTPLRCCVGAGRNR